jgi:methyl-accepting chemotaxis protein
MFHTIKARLIAITVGLVVITMSILSLANFIVARSNIIATVDTDLRTLNDSQSESISRWAKAQHAVLSSLQLNADATDIKPFLIAADAAGKFELAYIGFSDKRAAFSRPSSKRPADYDPTARPWYQQAIASDTPILTKPYIAASTGKLVVTFAERLPEQKGVIAADVLLNSVVDIVLSVKPTPHSYAFLVDSSGSIIAHPNGKWTLKPASEMLPSLSAPYLKSIAEAKQSVEMEMDGRPVFFSVRNVNDTNWMLAIVLDKKEAYETLNKVTTSSVIITVTAAFIAAIMLSVFIAQVLKRLLAVRDALEDISSGDRDLTRRLDASGEDELSQIAKSFNNFADQISGVLIGIRSASKSVKTSSEEIANGNSDLSSRTEQQAGALEETASTMEELTSTVTKNAENARLANKLTGLAADVAIKGGNSVSEVVKAMSSISDASKKIYDIISVIDGIAFQTNILALNAAVEAARAGESGRGFAVVASEVRRLAERSAVAASEIKVLISDSTSRVDFGAAQVEEAGKTMEETVTSIKQVATIMAEISDATEEQAQGIALVNAAIGQIDSLTQRNAALVQDAAAGADTLKNHAIELAEVVSGFKLVEAKHQRDPVPLLSR